MTMANAVPVTGIHHGVSGGRDRAMRKAVTIALPSLRNGQRGRLRSASMTASQARAVTVARVILTSTPQPKNHMNAAMPGSMAATTRSMMVVTMAGERI